MTVEYTYQGSDAPPFSPRQFVALGKLLHAFPGATAEELAGLADAVESGAVGLATPGNHTMDLTSSASEDLDATDAETEQALRALAETGYDSDFNDGSDYYLAPDDSAAYEGIQQQLDASAYLDQQRQFEDEQDETERRLGIGPKTAEGWLQRGLQRIQAGTYRPYAGEPEYDQAGMPLAYVCGPRGPRDDYGRCSASVHKHGCSAFGTSSGNADEVRVFNAARSRYSGPGLRQAAGLEPAPGPSRNTAIHAMAVAHGLTEASVDPDARARLAAVSQARQALGGYQP